MANNSFIMYNKMEIYRLHTKIGLSEETFMCFYKKRSVKIFIFTIMLLILCFSSVSFAVMTGLSTRKLALNSNIVIKGEVVEIVSQWTEGRTAIFSTATIRIEEMVTGSYDKENVKVVYDGGVIDGIGMKVSDTASFKKGETVILFLTPDLKLRKVQAYRVYGRAQGKYLIGKDNIARKRGFSTVSGAREIDNDLSVDELIEKIREFKNE
jgi:hypothetical protein